MPPPLRPVFDQNMQRVQAIWRIGLTANLTFAAGGSTRVAIPASETPNMPQAVRLNATAACYVRLGGQNIDAAVGDLLLSPLDSIILKIEGENYIAAWGLIGAGVLNVAEVL
ncbi:MAG: hypothetical protein WC551_10105 [Patescibacteria group bacterium]